MSSTDQVKAIVKNIVNPALQQVNKNILKAEQSVNVESDANNRASNALGEVKSKFLFQA
jgi:hypothetical protein